MNIIEKNKDEISALCEKYHVRKLFVFGSVLTDKFSNRSDIDFVVDFKGVKPGIYDFDYDFADNYFDFKYSLENLLRRKVDLLGEQAIKNPYLRQSIDNTKQMVYG
jgi:predicted nucleotidyltransferase